MYQAAEVQWPSLPSNSSPAPAIIFLRSGIELTGSPIWARCAGLLIRSFISPWSYVVRSKSPYDFDMALSSVDDCYLSCSEHMLTHVRDTFLPQELSQNTDFSRAWQTAKQKWLKKKKPLNGHLEEEHAVALLSYTLGGQKPIYAQFNQATRTGAQQYANGKFQYKSLHFLLADALRLIKASDDSDSSCLTVYRRSTVKFKATNVGEMVRFGSFTSCSLNKEKESFGRETCFVIDTCLGAKVGAYSANPHEEEVLIPPYEMFQVKGKKYRQDHSGLRCNVIYTLQSGGVYSQQGALQNGHCFPQPNSLLKSSSWGLKGNVDLQGGLKFSTDTQITVSLQVLINQSQQLKHMPVKDSFCMVSFHIFSNSSSSCFSDI
ncbi:hypothetical protein JZ751_010033 [Albula glossodonta]|uniref:NAD(P)(+)--arginine ADP-ribosyltransferase n=1 Tax=Albula glossodonta TaxID=121402 RepID=A0A8T2MMP5_9TELE|nr:hypothetical protein JZ751_010033 [Albula glossodonta]